MKLVASLRTVTLLLAAVLFAFMALSSAAQGWKPERSVFFTRPLSLMFLIGTVLILIVMVAPAMRRIKPVAGGE